MSFSNRPRRQLQLLTAAFWALLLAHLTHGQNASSRVVCAVNCWQRCLTISNGSDCGCFEESLGGCNFGNASDISVLRVTEPRNVHSHYADGHAHLLQLNFDQQQGELLFLLEISHEDSWTLINTSFTPDFTIFLPEICSEHQFRLSILMDDLWTLQILSPIVPTAKPPDFVVEAANMEQPLNSSFSNATDLVTVVYGWHHPYGYTRSDVMAYRATVHTIHCPLEERVSMPDTTMDESGGYLSVDFSRASVEAECVFQIFVSAHSQCGSALETVARLQLHCSAVINLPCEPEPVNPVCKLPIRVIDMAVGDGGALSVNVTWLEPPRHGRPLYYHVVFGPANLAVEFGVWSIAEEQHHKIDKPDRICNLTGLQLGEAFGVTVCAVYSAERKPGQLALLNDAHAFNCSCPLEEGCRCFALDAVAAFPALSPTRHPTSGQWLSEMVPFAPEAADQLMITKDVPTVAELAPFRDPASLTASGSASGDRQPALLTTDRTSMNAGSSGSGISSTTTTTSPFITSPTPTVFRQDWTTSATLMARPTGAGAPASLTTATKEPATGVNTSSSSSLTTASSTTINEDDCHLSPSSCDDESSPLFGLAALSDERVELALKVAVPVACLIIVCGLLCLCCYLRWQHIQLWCLRQRTHSYQPHKHEQRLRQRMQMTAVNVNSPAVVTVPLQPPAKVRPNSRIYGTDRSQPCVKQINL